MSKNESMGSRARRGEWRGSASSIPASRSWRCPSPDNAAGGWDRESESRRLFSMDLGFANASSSGFFKRRRRSD